MPGKNKYPMLGWHTEHAPWVRAEAERRGVPYSTVLDEAVAEKRERVDSESWTCCGCGGQMIGARTPDDLCAGCVAAALGGDQR